MIDIIYNQNNLKDMLFKRYKKDNEEVQKTVKKIIDDVKINGKEALFKYTKEFDKFDIDENTFKVTDEEIKKAYEIVDEEIIKVMKKSAQRIRDFHEKQKINSWFETSPNGEILGQLVRAIESVGVYVPGGKAAYPSSVLMNVIPAVVAGVSRIIMTTPVQKDGSINPNTLVAADIAGVSEIYKVGGAQAIAALAYGVEGLKKVDKICGPGNIFVATAKKMVYGEVNIDSVAGPSEILVLADESANPIYIASDMLSQAEHDELASSILITDSEKIAKDVVAELEKQTKVLERKEIIEKSLENYGAIIVVNDMKEGCDICNNIAPEHMEICTKSPFEILPMIKNAGAIFLGHYSPEPLGDYMAGPNHVIPTGGTARFFSPLSVDDFIKKSSIISFSKEALINLSDDIIKFANAEGLTAHANSIKMRKEK